MIYAHPHQNSFRISFEQPFPSLYCKLFLNCINLTAKIMEPKKAFFAIIILVAGYISFGQESNKYSELSEEAANLREKKE